MIRNDNGSNNSLFLSCQMGLSDGTFFMIEHTPLPNGIHPISSPVCPMGVADTLEPTAPICSTGHGECVTLGLTSLISTKLLKFHFSH